MHAERSDAASLLFPLLLKWSATLAQPPAFAPAFDDTFAYVAARDNTLLALALDSGEPAWSVECPMSVAPVAGDSLVFAGGAGVIQARAQEDGARRWITAIDGTVTSLAWDTGWLLAATDKNALVAIRAADGHVLWTRTLDAPLQAPPAAAGERLYLSMKNDTLAALTLQTGEPVWSVHIAKPADILPIGDRIYLGTHDDRLYCLSDKKGNVLWRWHTGGDVMGLPAIDEKRVYFVSLDNVLRALDRSSGSVLWQKTLPMRPSSGPLLNGWTLIVAGATAELRAFSSEFEGKAIGDLTLKTPQDQELRLAAPPHITTDEQLIIMTKSGEIRSYVGSPAPWGP